MLCIKKFASYIRIYYYYSYNCFKDIKDNIYITLKKQDTPSILKMIKEMIKVYSNDRYLMPCK